MWMACSQRLGLRRRFCPIMDESLPLVLLQERVQASTAQLTIPQRRLPWVLQSCRRQRLGCRQHHGKYSAGGFCGYGYESREQRLGLRPGLRQCRSGDMVAPRKSLRAWCSLRAPKLLTSLVRSLTSMAAFWPKEALSRVFKETDGPVSRQDSDRRLRVMVQSWSTNQCQPLLNTLLGATRVAYF